MKIFITGGSGLLGTKIAEIAHELGHETVSGYTHNIPAVGEPQRFDLADGNSIARAVDSIRPEVIFHTAALTDVDRCEADEKLAYQINVEGTRHLSLAARKARAFLVYVSTDYVFDGQRSMYREDDSTEPVNYYGCTKLLGEKYCSCVARTCVIYGSGLASGKVNFALWILDRLRKEEDVRLVTDQYVSPTLNSNLARMLLEAGEKKMSGVFHMAGATRVSRYDYACRLADAFGLDRSLIIPSKMTDMSWKAKRPKDSSLDTSKAARTLSEKPYDLEKSLRTLREEMK